MRISKNDTFDNVILESVKIESVRVDRHLQCYKRIHADTFSEQCNTYKTIKH